MLKKPTLNSFLKENQESLTLETIHSSLIKSIKCLNTDPSQLTNLFIETVQQAPLAISITDKKATILYINDFFTALTGYSANEIIGKNESKLSYKQTPREVYRDLWQTINRKQVWQGQLINKHKSGKPYLAELTIAPLLDDAGEITHYLGMHQDISKQHETEEQIKNQKKIIESMINVSPNAMMVVDENQSIILENNKYKALSSDQNIQEPTTLFLSAIFAEINTDWEHLNAEKLDFNNIEIRLENTKHQSATYFSCSGNWFKERDVAAGSFFEAKFKSYLLLTFSDITQQRKKQEESYFNQLKTIMLEEEQIRTTRETLLGAIHHFKQPMNQIAAAAEILKHKDEKNDELKALLDQILDSGEASLKVLQNCIPEIPQGSMRPVNLNQILHEIMMLLSHQLLSNGVIIEWVPTKTLPSVLAYENKLRMLFKLIIDNAIEAFNNQTRDQSLLQGERILTIITTCEQSLLHIYVKDNGPGIPEELRARVFEPFFSTHDVIYKHPGMGLVISKEIVNQHHGIIEVCPDVVNGCCIHICMPVHPETTIEEHA